MRSRTLPMTRQQRTALDDRILAALREEGPLTTGRLRELTGPHLETWKVRHGQKVLREDSGYPFQYRWEACPSCDCTELVDTTRSAAPRIRSALKRLEQRGLVMELQSPIPNNHGGNVWVRLDPPEAS